MLRFFLCAVVLVGSAVAYQIFDPKVNAMTARCRAKCLNKFYVAGSGANCFDNSDCWMCWDTCSMLYSNYKVWAPMCGEKQLCFPGCQESCNFHGSHSIEDAEMSRTDARFMQPLRYSYRAEDDSISFEWSRPEGSDDHAVPLVYVLLTQDQLDSSWHQLEQTFYMNATVRRGLLKLSSRLRLASFDSNGRIAQIEKPCSEFDFDSESESTDEMFRDEGHFDTNLLREHSRHNDLSLDFLDHRQHWSPALQSLRHSTKHLGGIDAVLSWPRVSHKVALRYEIEWKQADQASDITGQLSTYNNVGVVTMWPNSIYQVTVRAFAFGSRRSVAESKTLIVDTASQTSGSYPLIETCPNCIPAQYIIAVALPVLALIIIMGAILVRLRAHRPSVNGLRQPKTSTPLQSSKMASSFKRHTSVKRQLSSLGARLSQGSRTSSAKHGRLIEEDASSPRRLPSNDCNV